MSAKSKSKPARNLLDQARDALLAAGWRKTHPLLVNLDIASAKAAQTMVACQAEEFRPLSVRLAAVFLQENLGCGAGPGRRSEEE